MDIRNGPERNSCKPAEHEENQKKVHVGRGPGTKWEMPINMIFQKLPIGKKHIKIKPNVFWKTLAAFSFAVACISISQCALLAGSLSQAGGEKLFGLPLSNQGEASNPKVLDQYGIPFLKGSLKISAKSPAQLEVGGPVKRIFFLGMTETGRIAGWSDPKDYSVRFFIGDELGQIQLNYADGTTQVFPLILGESIWWSPPFNRFPEPSCQRCPAARCVCGSDAPLLAGPH